MTKVSGEKCKCGREGLHTQFPDCLVSQCTGCGEWELCDCPPLDKCKQNDTQIP